MGRFGWLHTRDMLNAQSEMQKYPVFRLKLSAFLLLPAFLQAYLH